MTKCVIHVGMPKTGTTSIQETLHNLDTERFVYARLCNFTGHGTPVFTLFAARPELHQSNSRRAHDAQAMRRFIARAGVDFDAALGEAQGRTLIISGEDILMLQQPELKAMRQRLNRKPEDITIAAYVRPPFSYMTSVFQERVRYGRLTAFVGEKLYHSYRNSFEKFDAVFGREHVQLWKFERSSLRGGDVVRDFCARIGLEIPESRIVRANEGSSREFVCLKFQYNRFCKANDFEPMTMPQVQSMAQWLKGLGQTKFRFASSTLRHVLAANRRDTAWMEERIGQSLDEVDGEEQASDIRGEDDLLQPVAGADETIRKALDEAEAKAEDGTSTMDLLHGLRRALLVAPGGSIGHMRWASSAAPGKREAAAPAARAKVQQLRAPPRPLINRDLKLVVVWSPLSECSATYGWFSHVSGFASEVRNSGQPVGHHRANGYVKSPLYLNGLDWDLSGARVLRIISNPYDRAIGMFRQVIQAGFATQDIRNHFGAAKGDGESISFLEFLEVATLQGGDRVNPVFRPQLHPLEMQWRPDVVVNVSKQDLFAALQEFELGAGLPVSRLEDLAWLQKYRIRPPHGGIAGDDLAAVPLDCNLVRGGKFPRREQLLTPRACAKIETIYKVDFDAYADYL